MIVSNGCASLLKNIRYLEVDPHILATGVIDDLNQDGITEELVLPVSYYFDSEEYRFIVFFNFLSSSEIWN